MKPVIAAGMMLFAWVSGEAVAACTAPPSTPIDSPAALGDLLRNNTVCATRGNEKWQEQHRANGDLVDFKKGANDPIDPTKKLGTWNVTGTGPDTQVSHTYDAFGPAQVFTYRVFDNQNGTYSFCVGASEIVAATIRPGLTSCP